MTRGKEERLAMDVVLPVKGVSRRVAGKNIRPFAGSSLLEVKIRQLRAVEGLARICVSSEDEGVLRMAQRLGAVPLYREPEYATDEVPMSEVYAAMAAQVETELVLLTHVTNPLAGAGAYRRCLDAFWEGRYEHGTLTTVAPVRDFLYLEGRALNFDPGKKPRSQDLPPIMRLTHVVSIAPREFVISRKEWFDHNPLFLELSPLESVDIDTELDFEVAEFLYQKHVPQGA